MQNNNQDLKSLYNLNSEEPLNNKYEDSDDEINISKEGLDKLYNQDIKTLDEEFPIEKNIFNKNEVTTLEKKEKNIKEEYITDEDLLLAYVGKNFIKISSKPFNFSAFIFSGYYLLFRKKILYAMIYFTIFLVLSQFIYSFIVGIGLSLIVGVLFNGLYIKDAKKKINKIKEKNSNKSMSKVKEICAKTGGTSVVSIIIGTIFLVIITMILFIIFQFVNLDINKTPLPI